MLYKTKNKSYTNYQKINSITKPNTFKSFYEIQTYTIPFLKFKYINLKVIVKQNNIFCTFSINLNSHYKFIWAGQQKIKLSKKTLKVEGLKIFNIFINKFLDQKLLKFPLRVSIISSKAIRRKLYTKLLELLIRKKKKKYLLEIPYKKAFNGCKARKIIRRKRKKISKSLYKYS